MHSGCSLCIGWAAALLRHNLEYKREASPAESNPDAVFLGQPSHLKSRDILWWIWNFRWKATSKIPAFIVTKCIFLASPYFQSRFLFNKTVHWSDCIKSKVIGGFIRYAHSISRFVWTQTVFRRNTQFNKPHLCRY